eukprot:TRINITY_DN449_c0_g1_i1.p1 TRINITY_DN449_c0_g1~~TRINITY_DN449_c0_g1_i1.p1  ORF type:complete len:1158 (-),score=300.28 TRINITY_DN449_c0_g1_i1:279-3752(-)
MADRPDLLSQTNVCGHTLLRLVSRGSAIIAELLRLGKHIPSVFQMDEPKFVPLLFDFQYLDSPDIVERKIEQDNDLLELDEQFRETHMPILERFYKLFESIFKYITDFNKFLQDLSDGVFIQQTFNSVLIDQQGKQLIAEAVHLYGVMLLLMDQNIDGPVRERMLMSYYRYKGPSAEEYLDDVCRLCRSTGYKHEGPFTKYPKGYPEDYFKRIPIQKTYIKMIVGRLRDDDIYQQSEYYPSPDHRSTALAPQATMLYVILFFHPEILSSEPTIMREICDKFFPDNWIIPFYLGELVDLTQAWLPYKAAKESLLNTIQPARAKEVRLTMWTRLCDVNRKLESYLIEGNLEEDYVLDNIPTLLSCVREANVAFRWLVLHQMSVGKKFREVVVQDVNPEFVLVVLFNTAQFEYVLRKMFTKMLAEKKEKWNTCKEQGKSRMLELSEYFSGEKMLTEKVKDTQLQEWFKKLADKIEELDYGDSTLAGRKIQNLINALEEVEQFSQIEASLQVKQFLHVTRGVLHRMIRYINVRELVLVTLAQVGDMSYSMNVIENYVDIMQKRIIADPGHIIKLRSTFLKLSSLMELPIVRITQAKSPDSESVAEYYSSEMVAFVRRVLEIVPKSMFKVLERVITLQTKIGVLPKKIERTDVKSFARMEERFSLAQATYEVAKYTEGILAMETTLMGIIQVDPKQLLEDGIRKELVSRIASALDKHLHFPPSKVPEFDGRLKALSEVLEGMFRSLEYIQDYINIYGVKIWHDEFSRIVNYFVEQECNSFLTTAVPEYLSEYQSDVIPIPRFPRRDAESHNCMGRLVREILRQTNPTSTIYVDQMAAWIDANGREAVNTGTFSLMHSAVGAFGLAGMDQLASFMIVKDCKMFIQRYRRDIEKPGAEFLNAIMSRLIPLTGVSVMAERTYSDVLTRFSKVWPALATLATRIGQKQLIRQKIANELNFSCKLDSNMLCLALDVLNRSLLSDVDMHYKSPETHPYPPDDSRLLSELSEYLENAGLSHPFTKIYVTCEPLEHVAFTVFMLVVSQMEKLSFEKKLDTLTCQLKEDPIDGLPFVVGVITILKQFHSSNRTRFLTLIGQYVRNRVHVLSVDEAKLKKKKKKKLDTADIPTSVVNVLHFLELFCRMAPLDRKVIENHIPAFLFDEFHPRE